MIVSNIPIDRKDMYPGMLLHINEEMAEFFSLPGKFFHGDDYIVPHGLWEVMNVTEHISHDLGPAPQETTWVEILHADWEQDDPFLVVLNRDSYAVLAGAILQPDPFKLVIVDRQQLDRANRNRSICAGCNQPLNIISANLKICNQCEQDLGV